MKRVALIAVWAVLLADVTRAEDLRPRFSHRFKLVGDFREGAIAGVSVPGELYDVSRSFPLDLRVIDDDGEPWSFFVGSPSVESEATPVRFKEYTTQPSAPGQAWVQVIYVIPDESEVVQHNRIAIRTQGSDFIRRVTLEGSLDGASWTAMGHGSVVDRSGAPRVRNHVIDYASSSFPLIRVTVAPDERNAGDVVEVKLVELFHDPYSDRILERVPLEAVADHEESEGHRLVLDTGVRHRPVAELRITAKRESYVMPVKVFGRNDGTNTWRWVADGGVDRVDGRVRSAVPLHGAAYRYLRIDVDAPEIPIDALLVEAWATPERIVFEAAGDSPAWIYVGGDDVPFPRFDLQHRLSPEQIENAQPCQLGKRRANPYRVVVVLRQYGWWMGGVAAGVLVVFATVTWARRRRKG